ncbi:MAG TPA: hypothetical protein VGL94_04820, partial [Ktedonobacteraceae bacterium]
MKGIARSYLEERAREIKIALACSSAERTPECQGTIWGSLWSSILTILRKVYPHATFSAAKGNKRRFPLTSLALLLVLIGLCSLFLGERQIAWAAEAHVAHPSVVTLQHSASTSSVTRAALSPSINNAVGPNPVIVNGQWLCPIKYVPQGQAKVVGGVTQYTEACVPGGIMFPCSDQLNDQNGKVRPNEKIIKGDWLVGDVPIATVGGTYVALGGHLVYTWSSETYSAPEIVKLFGYMETLAFFLIIPSILLVGYQIMLGAVSFRYVDAIEGLSRVLLGGLAVVVSYGLVQTFVSLETSTTAAVLLLHVEHPFPRIAVNGVPVPYVLAGATSPEPNISYRGIVMPISRWGCAINDFLGIFSVQFVSNTLASVIPLLSGFTHFAGAAMTMADVIHRISGLILMALSVVLFIQVFVRIFLLNYYILMSPLAFGCWALPGKVGQRVLRLWCKGFFSILFIQVL